MRKCVNLIGQKFNQLLVLSEPFRVGNRTFAKCRCDCGEELDVRQDVLQNGDTKTCGCSFGKHKITHGHTRESTASPEYRAWHAIKKRCYNLKYENYNNYGGRGIKVCDRWLNSFENFLEDMGPKPTSKHTIERNNVDGDYSKDNCRWATNKEQQNNKRNSLQVTFKGETKTIAQWSEEFGIKGKALYRRYHRSGTKDFEQLFLSRK